MIDNKTLNLSGDKWDEWVRQHRTKLCVADRAWLRVWGDTEIQLLGGGCSDRGIRALRAMHRLGWLAAAKEFR